MKVIRLRKKFSTIACRICSREIFLTNKFARRFVIGGIVIIRMTHRYLGDKALRRETPFASQQSA